MGGAGFQGTITASAASWTQSALVLKHSHTPNLRKQDIINTNTKLGQVRARGQVLEGFQPAAPCSVPAGHLRQTTLSHYQQPGPTCHAPGLHPLCSLMHIQWLFQTLVLGSWQHLVVIVSFFLTIDTFNREIRFLFLLQDVNSLMIR